LQVAGEFRRKWDREEYEAIAQKRIREEEEEEEGKRLGLL